MLLPSLLKSGDQVYQKVIKQLYQKMLLLNLLITNYSFLNSLFSDTFFCTSLSLLILSHSDTEPVDVLSYFLVTTVKASLL